MGEDLDPFMLAQRRDSGWTLPGLGAKGPASPLRKELGLFGQFVGDWEIFPRAARSDPKLRRRPVGEAHWRWVLGGLAVQDVWGHVDPNSGRFVPQGTTLRFYDRRLTAWRSTWISPYQRSARRFIGRKEGSQIVLRERDAGWRGERWIFSEITGSTFRWRAEARKTARGAWKITEDYWIHRIRRPRRH
jgi:hypothetical protein